MIPQPELKMKIRNRRQTMTAAIVSLFAASTFLTAAALAVPSLTPEQLDDAKKSGEISLFIDIRSSHEFEQGHIPGAINIPFFALESRQIPAKGKVAVYADGLGKTDDLSAAAQINKKPGIEAVLLKGGLAAWESAGLPTTHKMGLRQAETPVITYQTLQKIQAQGVVLGDLRQRGPMRTTAAANSTATDHLTDLSTIFPDARIVEPEPLRVAQSTGSHPQAASDDSTIARQLSQIAPADELIVLIDNGDGSAEKTLRKLRASGNKRVVILAGGESIIRREGRAGMGRVGYTVGETSDPEAPN